MKMKKLLRFLRHLLLGFWRLLRWIFAISIRNWIIAICKLLKRIFKKRGARWKKWRTVLVGVALILAGIGLFSIHSQASTQIDKFVDELKVQVEEFFKPFGRTPVELVLRDIIIASVAHIKAGDDIPYEIVYGIEEVDWNRIDYSRAQKIDPNLTWGLETNSIWLADKMRVLIPFFEYEGIREIPRTPTGFYFLPYPPEKSFHTLGSANIKEGYVLINERFTLEGSRRDLRQLYSTLVHELIHQQEGGFGVDFIKNIELPSRMEPRTQAATIETLAAWCHYRDEIACKAFWSEIEHFARGSLLMRLKMYGYEEVYDVIANLLWRTKDESTSRNKSLRHWMEDPETQREYYNIIDQYQKMPWEDVIVEGICGKGLRTGFIVEHSISTEEHPLYKLDIMPFDDTVNLLGNSLVNLICRLPHGPAVH